MCNNKKYNVVIFLCIVSLVILIFQNYRVQNIINEKQNKTEKMEKKVETKGVMMKNFGYGDIINAIGNQQGVKITKFVQQKEHNIASVEIDVCGDMSLVEEVLKNMASKDNFQNIQNIKIEKCEDNKIIAKMNVNFIKNR